MEGSQIPEPTDAPLRSGTATTRRQLLRRGALLAVAAALPAGRATAREASPPVGAFVYDGSADPISIPWLDKNGSLNQSPGPGHEPSHIFHFKGLVARCNDFTGMGTDNKGRRLAFGAPTTDFGFMQGEYFSGRTTHTGVFAHT